jgi:hypothetical protein
MEPADLMAGVAASTKERSRRALAAAAYSDNG